MRRLGVPFLIAALISCLPLYAAAESYDPTTVTASEIFKNEERAAGKRDPGDYTEVQIERSGGIQWTRTTVWKGGDMKTTVSGAGLMSAYGRYQHQSWSQDDNGIVTIESNFRQSEDPNILAFRHPNLVGSNVRVLGITQITPKQYVVEVHPATGDDRFFYYDVTTSLLSQIVTYPSDRYRHVTEYSDYRKIEGLTLPYHVRSYDGRPQNDVDWTIDSYLPTSANVDMTIPNGVPLFTYSGDTPLQLPATFTRDGIIIRLILNGHGMDFLLDSGASGLFIDPGAAVRAGLKPVGRRTYTIGGDVDIGEVRVPTIQFGNLVITNAVFNTSPFDDVDGDHRIVGLVGFDFLASGIFGVDFKKQTLTLFPRDHFDPNAMALVGEPLQLDDGIPRTDISIEGVRGHFAVDLGSFMMLAYKGFVDRLPHAPTLTNQASIGTVGGSMPSKIIKATDIIFGGVKFGTGVFVEPSNSKFNIQDYDGLIGRDMLYNYRSYFDYDDGMLYLKETIK